MGHWLLNFHWTPPDTLSSEAINKIMLDLVYTPWKHYTLELVWGILASGQARPSCHLVRTWTTYHCTNFLGIPFWGFFQSATLVWFNFLWGLFPHWSPTIHSCWINGLHKSTIWNISLISDLSQPTGTCMSTSPGCLWGVDPSHQYPHCSYHQPQ